ncbi:MAG TPA: glycosyltransferase family A protein [Pseudolabrys sp.]|nr:glycosyltransferase family A protein [Pseudolabrys sp.]
MKEPLVSILVTTYNRSHLLGRAIESVLAQDFKDYELVIIDDCSSDNTQDVIRSYRDDRIINIRNDENVGSKLGDRAHKRRFVYELMRGRYFANFCDDDYWLNDNLLSRQVAAFAANKNLAMVLGGQLTYFLDETSPMPKLTADNLGDFINLGDYSSKDPNALFMRPPLDAGFMTSERFLRLFAEAPGACNINGGAALMSREHYIEAKALLDKTGSQWQAGYEYFLGPASFGDVVYLESPELVVEARPQNASFRWTQVAHYQDAILSIDNAFAEPLVAQKLSARRAALLDIKKRTIANLTFGFVQNTLTIRKGRGLSLCSEENIRSPVTLTQAVPVLAAHRVVPDTSLLMLLFWISPIGHLWQRLQQSFAQFSGPSRFKDFTLASLKSALRTRVSERTLQRYRALRDRIMDNQ